jgi:uncharacterized protein (DUF4415 family)
MARKPDPYLIDDENPELTDEELVSARPASSVLPPGLYAALASRNIDVQPEPAAVEVRLELDPRVLEAFRKKGPGWEERINDTLKKAVGL